MNKVNDLEFRILQQYENIKIKMYAYDNLDFADDIKLLKSLTDDYKKLTGTYFNVERLQYGKK